MWRIDGDTPKRLQAATLPSEATLESYLEGDPSLLGDRLLVIGRQVRTPHGKLIDLLAIDAEGNLHVLELKREKTPRDVVAQVLDPGSERIVTYLRTFGVPVNAVFFSYLEDDGRRYLARTWLARDDETDTGGTAYGKGAKRKRADWNGRDWFVSFGPYAGGRQWEDGRKFGFVSAGGDAWYSRTVRNVPVGGRVNVYIPQEGYVAVGETIALAQRFDEVSVIVDGREVPLAARSSSVDSGTPCQVSRSRTTSPSG